MPPPQGGGVVALILDVDGLVAILWVAYHGQEKPLRVGVAKASVAVARPLHGRAHSVAVPEVDIVAHPDLVTVVDDRYARQGEDEEVEQLYLAAVVIEQGREAAADALIELGSGIFGKDAIQVIALLLGDHREGEVVLVAQE